ncbi:MAG: hypothetical protein DMG88_09090 [Acidobacteria bacterium]|nr:MAG: hypothetical protein DMG88_09090 [Acidobacteriota bacterium]
MALAFLLYGFALGQIQVHVPAARFRPHNVIDVVIRNVSAKDVSFCVEYGFRSFRDPDHPETTPTPVYVKRKDKHGWNTLLIGPDVGSMRHSVSLGPGEFHEYPFRLSDSGTMRVLLDYWLGENNHACENPKGRKTAKSRLFVVE